jgi:flavodoxin
MTARASNNTHRLGPAEELAITALGRRSFLRGALAGVAGVAIGAPMSGCSASAPHRVAAGSEQGPAGSAAGSPVGTASTGSKVLLAYFSRAGENYYYGGRTQLEVGNTEVVAGMISRRIGCDVHRIEPVEPYPDDYDETVARNVREQDADARPAVANPPASLARYDIVLLGSPIWNVRPPMIMATFAERFDFAGKTIFPFVTYAVSGLGTTARDYAASCPGATIGEGLAVRGEEVREAGAAVEAWLRRIGLLKN